VINILQGSAITQMVLGGLIINTITVNFLNIRVPKITTIGHVCLSCVCLNTKWNCFETA